MVVYNAIICAIRCRLTLCITKLLLHISTLHGLRSLQVEIQVVEGKKGRLIKQSDIYMYNTNGQEQKRGSSDLLLPSFLSLTRT
jgi:hypothetical protein